MKESQEVTVRLYNTLGKRVRTVYQGTPPGDQLQQVQIEGETSRAAFISCDCSEKRTLRRDELRLCSNGCPRMTALTHPVGRMVLAAVGLFGLVGVGEVLRRVGVPATVTRRLVHGGVGLFVVATPWLFSAPAPVYGLAVLFALVNTATRALDWWCGTHGGRSESWGTVTFPLALVPALAATWSVNPGRTFVLQIAFLVLALADPIAAWVGTYVERPGAYRLGSDEKSVAGSGAFFIVALACTTGGLALARPSWAIGDLVGAGLSVAGAAAAVEALAGRGWDNFFVVIAAVAVLLVVEQEGSGLVLAGLVGGGCFGAVAYAARALTASGGVAAGLLAATLVAGGGTAWVVPGLVFFVLSSALSFLPRSYEDGVYGKRKMESGRRAEQVYANGAVAWGLLLGHVALPHPAWYAGFLGALAAAAADTWATEVGARSTDRPWSLRTGTTVDAGVSGAVSIGGTVGAILGAASVAGAAWCTGGALGATHGSTAVGVVAAGVIGMAADSVAGATVQARYRHPDAGHLVEETPTPTATPARGWAVIGNEAVNLLGTTAGALTAILLV